MSLLPPELRQRLRRTRLLAGGALASGGVGERRSRNKGEGIEFEDFRPYAYGDDLRRLDPHVYARLGEHVIRQYNVHERLAVTVLLDTSASMGFGEPSKLRHAAAITAGLAFSALSGSDTVRCGALTGGEVRWYPRLSGAGRQEELESWLLRLEPGGTVDLVRSFSAAAAVLPPNGLLILLSDLWSSGVDELCDVASDARQTLVVVRVLAPEEVDPTFYGTGPVRMVDSETGAELEVELGPSAFELYSTLFAKSADDIRRQVLKVGGRLVTVTTATDLGTVFTRSLTDAGIVR